MLENSSIARKKDNLPDPFAPTSAVNLSQCSISSLLNENADYATVCLAPSNQDHSLKEYYCFKSYVTGQIAYVTGQIVFWLGKGDPPTFSEVKDIPEGFQTANSFSGKNDPYSQDPPRIYEFKVPIKYVGSAALYAFYVQGNDGFSSTLLAWPDSAVKVDLISFVGVHPPEVWGILESPNGVIPEFPASLYYVLPIAVSLTMVVVMLRFRKNSWSLLAQEHLFMDAISLFSGMNVWYLYLPRFSAALRWSFLRPAA